MDHKKYFIGIDVAKDTLEIAINKQTEPIDQLKLSNDLKGIKAFEKKPKNRTST